MDVSSSQLGDINHWTSFCLKLPEGSNRLILFCKYLNYDKAFAKDSKRNLCICTDTTIVDRFSINILSWFASNLETSHSNCSLALLLVLFLGDAWTCRNIRSPLLIYLVSVYTSGCMTGALVPVRTAFCLSGIDRRSIEIDEFRQFLGEERVTASKQRCTTVEDFLLASLQPTPVGSNADDESNFHTILSAIV